MKKVFVDANVFLCYLTQIDASQQIRAEQLFKKATAGRIELVTGPPVFFELAWTLRKVFRQSRVRILEALCSLLAIPGLTLLDRSVVEKAIDHAETCGVEFADAYIAASALMAGADSIATFNREDFEKLPTTLLDF